MRIRFQVEGLRMPLISPLLLYKNMVGHEANVKNYGNIRSLFYQWMNFMKNSWTPSPAPTFYSSKCEFYLTK